MSIPALPIAKEAKATSMQAKKKKKVPLEIKVKETVANRGEQGLNQPKKIVLGAQEPCRHPAWFYDWEV